MVLWVDKYRPTTLDKLDLHEKITSRLRKMVASGDFPHLLFFGPSGAGKKTRVMAVLRELYGSGVEKIRVETKSFKVKSSNVEITTLGSNYHIEMNPSDAGIRDRLVVQEVIKDIAQSHTLDPSHQRAFKVVVLSEVDRLSRDAQHALRRTMEKYTGTCRLVLLCESACRVMEPLRSRCLSIRVPAPTSAEITTVLNRIAKKEHLNPHPLPDDLVAQIVKHSRRNLRKAILMLEACKVEAQPFASEQKVQTTDWERFVDHVAALITEEQSPQRLLLVRGKIYELLVNCIPPDTLIKALAKSLLKRSDDQVKHRVVQLAAYYEHRMRRGSKPLFHIEAFIAKFMAVYKRWVVQTFT